MFLLSDIIVVYAFYKRWKVSIYCFDYLDRINNYLLTINDREKVNIPHKIENMKSSLFDCLVVLVHGSAF